MSKKRKEKIFDSVDMMRSIRDALSKRYHKKPEVEEKELEQVRRQYGIVPRNKISG